MNKFSITISKVLIFVLFITLTVITSFLGAYDYIQKRNAMRNELLESMENIAERLGINLFSPLYEMNIFNIRAIIKSEMKNRNIYAVVIKETDGQVFYSVFRDENWQISEAKTDIHFDSKDYIMRNRKIIFRHELIGNVEVVMTKMFLIKKLKSLLKKTLISIFLINIVAIIILFIALRFILIVPIRELQKYSNEIGTENLEADRPVAFFFGELLILNIAIQQMVSNLKLLIGNLRQTDKELRGLTEELEQRVKERTAEVEQKNLKLLQANQNLEETLKELQKSQAQLIQSEKMAALGQLIAGVAHEINTPLGAIRASAGNITASLDETLEGFPRLVRMLSEDEQKIFFSLIRSASENKTNLSAREERKLKRALTRTLEEQEIRDADTIADTLTDMGVCDNTEEFLPLLRHPENSLILQSAYNLSGLRRGTENITTATDRASKIVFALKNYARFDHTGEPIRADLTEGIETVLTLYHNQLKQGIDVIRNYEECKVTLHSSEVSCYPDELNQVWTNLIHNAIQAMEGKGTLTIDLCHKDDQVVVSFTDTGKGIPDEIKERIFEPFFTTKAAGEGSGLGLDIVKKIIDKHKGKIEVGSEPGKTIFRVMIPKT